jgi:hypothetical protein
MRHCVLIFLASLLLVPAALAERRASGDGSLVVSNASARSIVLKGNGLIFGHLGSGTLTVVEYDAADTSAPQISGSTGRVVGNAVVYTGTDLRFLFPNGKYLLRLEGNDIDISAVGKGTVTAAGLGSADDGTLTVNNGKAQPVSLFPAAISFNGNGNSGAAKAQIAAVATPCKG